LALSNEVCRLRFIVIALTAMSGCRPSPNPASATRSLPRIAIVGESLSAPSHALLESAAQSFVDENPALMVELMAPKSHAPALQRKLLEELNPRSFAALCVFPSDPATITPALERLTRGGLTTVVLGRDVAESARLAYCGPSETEIGEAAARACRQVLRDEASTILLLVPETPREPYTSRLNGFRGAFIRWAREAKAIEVPCPENPIEALRAVETESHKFPRVGCWVFFDDWPLRMMGDAERLPTGGSAVVLCHPAARHFDRLRRGEITALIGYDLQAVMTQGLALACEAMRRPEEGMRDQFVESKIVTRGNLDEYQGNWTPTASSR